MNPLYEKLSQKQCRDKEQDHLTDRVVGMVTVSGGMEQERPTLRQQLDERISQLQIELTDLKLLRETLPKDSKLTLRELVHAIDPSGKWW